MIDKCTDSVWIAEIDPQSNTRIGKGSAIIIRDVDSIAEKGLIDGSAEIIEQQKV